MISDRIPDETSILAFCHLLEKHDPAPRSARWAHLTPCPSAWRDQGTIIETTLLTAPSSTFTGVKPDCAGVAENLLHVATKERVASLHPGLAITTPILQRDDQGPSNACRDFEIGCPFNGCTQLRGRRTSESVIQA